LKRFFFKNQKTYTNPQLKYNKNILIKKPKNV